MLGVKWKSAFQCDQVKLSTCDRWKVNLTRLNQLVKLCFNIPKNYFYTCIFIMQSASVNYFVFHVILEIKNIEAFTIRQNEKDKILKGKMKNI